MEAMPHPVLQGAVALCLVLGAALMLITGVGLVRFPDVFCRMHAAGKAGTLGIALLILGPSLYFLASDLSVPLRGAAAIVFQLLTTPGAAYLLAHACYVTNHPRHDRTALDELAPIAPQYPPDERGRA